MKKINYIFILFVGLLAFSSCNSSETQPIDIEYSQIHPMGGQYRISIVDETGATVKFASSAYSYCYLSNVVDETDATHCWIRIGNYNASKTLAYSINGKIDCDVSSLSFSGKNVMNLAGNATSSPNTFNILDGKIELKGITTPSKTVTDKISFKFTNSLFPGKTYTVTGYRYTGWPED